MNEIDAEKIITEYLKPVFGFALKRCRSIQDAEDLSQEIAVKVFRTLLTKDDVVDVDTTNRIIVCLPHTKNTMSVNQRKNCGY